MPSLLILLPFAVLIILNMPFRHITIKASFLFAILLSLIQVFLVLIHPVLFWSTATDPLGPFFAFKFFVDNLTLVSLLSIGLVAFISVLVGWFTIDEEKDKFNFINLLLIALIGMNTIAMVTGLFSMYVFIEITAVASFIMIAIQKNKFALEGAFKYLILSAIASVMMLISIGLIFLIAGDTSFFMVSNAFKGAPGSIFVKIAIGLFLCGAFIKSGIVPFHGWLPDAYSAAPAGTSVILAGIVTKMSGVYILIRLVISVFGFEPQIKNILMFAGGISIIFGALASLNQSDFKRMLAYSSISQVGYIILALGCGTSLAVAGAVFHFFNHAVFKSLLFTNAAAVEKNLGTMDMGKMGGLAERMPVTGATSIIGFLSTAGVPPFSGFWSKLIIILALWKSNHYAYAVIALLASILTLAYLLTMQRKVFFGKLDPMFEDIKEVNFGLVFPAILLAGITVGVGLFFPVILDKFIYIIQSVSW